MWFESWLLIFEVILLISSSLCVDLRLRQLEFEETTVWFEV